MTGREIIDRLEKLTGPSRAVDAALTRLLVLPECREPDCFPDLLARLIDRVERGEWDQDPDVPFLTSSLDAIVALIEQMLPGCKVGFDPVFFEENAPVKWDAIICRPDWQKWTPHGGWIIRWEARHSCQEVAACIALLKAMEAGQ